MGAVVRNLDNVKGRWKYRKVIPVRLRPHIDGNITEFVRWLGEGTGQPSPDVLRKYAARAAECETLIKVAEKRASGRFDDLTAETVAHIIATARSELLEEDEEARFDETESALSATVQQQLKDAGVAFVADTNTDGRWNERQEELEATLALWRHEYARGMVSDFVTEEALDRCAALGLCVDPDSLGFRRLAKAYLTVLIETGEASLKRQRGELIQTPEAPAPKPVEQLLGVPDQTITGLVSDWWKEAKAAGRSVSTHEAYERVARQFADYLQHDDANLVSKAEVIRFKDHRLGQGAAPKTVKDSDLAGLRSLFRWAVANGRVKENPAEGVTVIAPKKVQLRPKGFTDEEAKAILTHANSHRQQPGEGAKIAAAKRWVPWLCAYTGARVGEMVQLRRQDLRRDGDIWVLSLSPDAVTVKGGKFREVPLHSHLVEMGFPAFIEASDQGFLFLQPSEASAEAERGAWRTAKNRVTEFVRKVVTDERVQPNHAWRHRMETLTRNLDIRRDVTDAITGHTTPGVAASYGDVTLEAKAAAVAKLPRYVI